MSNELAPKPLSVVLWLDAHGGSVDDYAEDELNHIHSAKPLSTWGFILKDDEKGITLFHEWSPEDGRWRGRRFIPRGMIVEVIELGMQRRPRKKKAPTDVKDHPPSP